MKKLFALTLICSICLSFMACGSDDDDEKKDDKEKFVWNGDWNDPNDPNYYGGYYNPIEGDWIDIDNPNFRYIFDENFSSSTGHKSTSGTWKIEPLAKKYIVNNTAFYQRLSYRPYMIKKEDEIESLSIYMDKQWRKHKRYKE